MATELRGMTLDVFDPGEFLSGACVSRKGFNKT